MNKCMSASIISLHKLKPCTRNDIQCSVLSSCTSLFSWSLLCILMHTNIRYRWLLLFVVVQYDLNERQIKSYLDKILSLATFYSQFCPFTIQCGFDIWTF